MLRITEEFYSQLYTVEQTDNYAQTALLNSCSDNIDNHKRAAMNAEITAEEIEVIVSKSRYNSAPGLDRLP